MTADERRGIEIARSLLERELEAGSEPQGALEAACRWITSQLQIDQRRRRTRGKYRTRT